MLMVCAGSGTVWVCDVVVRTDIDQADMIHSTCPNLKGPVVGNDGGIKKVLCGGRQEDGVEPWRVWWGVKVSGGVLVPGGERGVGSVGEGEDWQEGCEKGGVACQQSQFRVNRSQVPFKHQPSKVLTNIYWSCDPGDTHLPSPSPQRWLCASVQLWGYLQITAHVCGSSMAEVT